MRPVLFVYLYIDTPQLSKEECQGLVLEHVSRACGCCLWPFGSRLRDQTYKALRAVQKGSLCCITWFQRCTSAELVLSTPDHHAQSLFFDIDNTQTTGQTRTSISKAVLEHDINGNVVSGTRPRLDLLICQNLTSISESALKTCCEWTSFRHFL